VQHRQLSGIPLNTNSLGSVLQGSILGPFLFIVYINDMIHVSEIADIILFADDTNMFLSHPSFDTLLTLVNNELF
jgi:hypothetical protein